MFENYINKVENFINDFFSYNRDTKTTFHKYSNEFYLNYEVTAFTNMLLADFEKEIKLRFDNYSVKSDNNIFIIKISSMFEIGRIGFYYIPLDDLYFNYVPKELIFEVFYYIEANQIQTFLKLMAYTLKPLDYRVLIKLYFNEYKCAINSWEYIIIKIGKSLDEIEKIDGKLYIDLYENTFNHLLNNKENCEVRHKNPLLYRIWDYDKYPLLYPFISKIIKEKGKITHNDIEEYNFRAAVYNQWY